MIRTIFTMVAMLLVLSSCNDKTTVQQTRSEPVYSKQFRKDSTTVILSVSATNIPASGKIQLIVDVHAPSGSEVTFPSLDKQLGTFTIIDGYTEPIQVLENGKQLYRRAWIIAPSQPGTTMLEPFDITVGVGTITTEPITVAVTSILPSELESLDIRDIAPPIELLPQQETKRKILLRVIPLAMLTVGIALWYKFFRRSTELVFVPPHEAAFLALENLPTDTVDKIHALSSVLKNYLEQRYNLPIAGKTLDETLPFLPEDYRDELTEFLITCQQIRFSNKVPEGFIEEAFNTVATFVEKTREDDVCA